MVSTEVAIRKKELQLVERERTISLVKDLMRNPVFEIIAGYLILEWAQRKVVAQTTVIHDPILGEEHEDIIYTYLLPSLAGSVAEAGLLVAVALQQGGSPVLEKIFEGGADVMKMGLGIVPNVLKTALTTIAK